MILRKSSVPVQAGEQLLIPINIRNGSLLCIGKGNEDRNFSAPHGAGRLMSRAQAKQSFTVYKFKKQMADIYTTSVGSATLDECPMAYKGIQDILDNIGSTAEVVKIIRPIYNFKAGEEGQPLCSQRTKALLGGLFQSGSSLLHSLSNISVVSNRDVRGSSKYHRSV